MVNNKILKTWTLGVCLWCVVGETLALGLGEVEIYSALGRPLLAEIPIFDSANESLHRGSLVVGLADEATHRKVGLPYPYFLRYLKFSIDETRIDNPRIRVTSSASISEPLFHFLMEFRWPETRLLKEVTVLLDPPTGNSWFARAEQGRIAETQANERTTTAGSHLGQVRKRAPATGFDTRTYGPIASGESLSQIAAQLSRKRNTGLREMMTGLYTKNPHAFGASMDVLKRGAVLDIPTAQELAQISVAEQVPKTTTKSPGDPHSEPVSEQVALKPSGLAQFDRETVHDPGLRILSSASAATRQEHNNDMPGANPAANAYTAQAIPTAHAVQTSTPSVEFRLERAARDLQMLRAENESMRKAMANMQNELLVNRDSFEKMLTKYEGLLAASQKSQSVDKVATTLPYATWVPWLTLLVAIGIIGGIGLIGLRMHQGRKHRVGLENVGAKSSVSIPLDEILDSVQREGMLDSAPERSRLGLPQGQGYSMSQSAAGLSVSHLHETGETTVPEAPIRNDDTPMPAEINSGVIAEYLATGEFNITDANIAREIVNSEGNSEVKLVLLAFYKELGKHKDLLRLADEILARHPHDDSEFRKHVLAIRNTASEVTRRSAATHGFETRSDERIQQTEVAHSCGNSDPSARHWQNQETAIEEASTAIYHADRGGGENMDTNPHDARCVGDSNPSDSEDSHSEEAQASRSQQGHGNDSDDTQASAQSVSEHAEDASEWPELYDVFAPETEILEQEQALDDQHVDSAPESRREAGRVTAAEVRPGDDQEPTKQSRAELDSSKEFAPGLPDPSLLDEPEQASDEEVVDTQLWVDSGAQSDTIAHNREEYEEWFRQHTGSDHKN